MVEPLEPLVPVDPLVPVSPELLDPELPEQARTATAVAKTKPKIRVWTIEKTSVASNVRGGKGTAERHENRHFVEVLDRFVCRARPPDLGCCSGEKMVRCVTYLATCTGL